MAKAFEMGVVGAAACSGSIRMGGLLDAEKNIGRAPAELLLHCPRIFYPELSDAELSDTELSDTELRVRSSAVGSFGVSTFGG